MFKILFVLLCVLSCCAQEPTLTTASPTTTSPTSSNTTEAPTASPTSSNTTEAPTASTQTPTTLAPTAPSDPLVCERLPQANCTGYCVKVFGKNVNDSLEYYLGCGLNRTSCTPVTEKCYKRANIQSSEMFFVTLNCTIFDGLVPADCTEHSLPDDRQSLETGSLFSDGCVLHYQTWKLPQFDQRSKFVTIFNVTSNRTLNSLKVRFNFTRSADLEIFGLKKLEDVNNVTTATVELFGALTTQSTRHFGFSTYDDSWEEHSSVQEQTYSVESSAAPSQNVEFLLTIDADVEYFNLTRFTDALNELFSNSTLSARLQTNARAIEQYKIILTFTGENAAKDASEFLYLQQVEDPSLAEANLRISKAVYYESTSTSSDDDDSGLSRKAIIGIIIASIVGAILIVAIIVVVIKSRSGGSRDEAKTQMLY